MKNASNRSFSLAAAVVSAVAMAASPGWAVLSGDPDVSTDFEEFVPNTMFGDAAFVSDDTAPNRVTFTGDQWIGFAGVPELYTNFTQRAWMVLPTDGNFFGGEDGVGIMTFETPAAEVSFFARLRSVATGNTVITAFDVQDQQVDQIILDNPATPFQEFCFTGEIARVEVVNNDTQEMNGIEDLAYIVPEPATSLGVMSSLAALLGLRAYRVCCGRQSAGSLSHLLLPRRRFS